MASVKSFWVLVPFVLSLAFNSSAPSLAGELTDAVKSEKVDALRGHVDFVLLGAASVAFIGII